MTKRDRFIEISLRTDASSSSLPEFNARLPLLMGGPEDAEQLFASMKALVIGGGGIGGEITQHLGRWQIEELAVVDPKRFKSESLLTHSIPPEAVGESKAFYAARLAKRLSPRTRVFALEGMFESLSLSDLARFDVVFLATDGLLAEVQVSQACLSLGIPVVQGSVHGESLCGHVRFFGHGGPEAPCAACGFTREEWSHLNRSTVFSCEGLDAKRTTAASEPTMSLSPLCSLIAQLALLQYARDRLGLGVPVRDTVLEYCAYTHQTVVTKLHRNADCPCDHVTLRRTAPPRPLAECSLDDLEQAAGASENGDGAVSFEVENSIWADRARCQCGEWRPLGQFVSRAAASVGRCRKCHGMMTVHPFHSYRLVPASAVEFFRNQSLGELGASGIRWAVVRCNGRAALFLNAAQTEGQS